MWQSHLDASGHEKYPTSINPASPLFLPTSSPYVFSSKVTRVGDNANNNPTSTFYLMYSVTQPAYTPMTISLSTLTGNTLRLKMASSTSTSGISINDAKSCPTATSSQVTCGTHLSGVNSYITFPSSSSVTVHQVIVFPSNYEDSTDNSAVYTIVATRASSAHPTQLLSSATILDMPPHVLSGSSALNTYSFYVLSVPPSSNSFSLSVSPQSTSSNPALYINKDSFFLGNEGGDNNAGATWSSDRPGHQRETIDVASTDANFIHGGGNYYVTVSNPVTDSPQPFTISPVTESGNPIFLQPGSPQHDSLTEGQYRYYQYYTGTGVDADKSVVIDVTPEYGDPDVYVGCKFWAGSEADPNDGYPSMSPGHFNGSSTLPFEDSIIVSSSLNDSPPATDGNSIVQDCPIIYIAIYAYPLPNGMGSARTCDYSITAVPAGGVTNILAGTR